MFELKIILALIPVGEFQSLTELLMFSEALQTAFIVLIVGIVSLVAVYRKFSSMIKTKKFHYKRPHASKFLRTVLLPVFAIILISSINLYIYSTGLFNESVNNAENPSEIFSKILTTLNIIVIGYTISQIIPIILTKKEKSSMEHDDFLIWKEKHGFEDDEKDFFNEIYDWIPPKNFPKDMVKEKFESLLSTDEGLIILQQYRTSKGMPIGSYKPKVPKPFEEYKKSERKKYDNYYNLCTSENNDSGMILKPGVCPQEIFPIDTWREEKRFNDFDEVIAGEKPPGYATKRREGLPKSLYQVIPIVIFAVILVGVVSWWGVDLLVLGTVVAGLGVGIGFALKETMENFFAYVMIKKDKIFIEGDRVEIDGYNGYIHKITSRVTYVRHALNESMAIFPTRQLIATKVINYSNGLKFVPATVEVGVSYLNDARQVTAILRKVGYRAMREITDDKENHLVTQKRCPYLEDNKPSCGCDKGMVQDIEQPKIRFEDFNNSSLDFKIWVYVRDYQTKYRVQSAIRVMIQEEFKEYDIRIPWPIRTIYNGDEKQESDEISKLDDKRQKVLDEYGLDDISVNS
ncbi:mechanosensitive ion channel family protein [Nitrosopumilus sp. K4]|uniref:mechanosensitive ion channel family protein n=1 Tax=Nitrosopumilus sp. K4 TaxID=2795383 RepID=UPI00353040F3